LRDLEAAKIIWGRVADLLEVFLAAPRKVSLREPNIEIFDVKAHCVRVGEASVVELTISE
jgi:hypothetical protein